MGAEESDEEEDEGNDDESKDEEGFVGSEGYVDVHG